MLAARNTLHELAERAYANNRITVKQPHYWTLYERLIGHRRHLPLRVLEIGVYNGDSIKVWEEYLPGATIVGLDIGECPPHFPRSSRIHFVQGSQADPVALDQAIKLAGGSFDIIIDDASHIGWLTKAAFKYLFPALQPGGHYVIEDFAAPLLDGWGDGAKFSDYDGAEPAQPSVFESYRNGMIGFLKQTVDHLAFTENDGRGAHLPIAKIEFLPNIAVIEKAA
jgi:SAM-dependent methyltransferase